MEMRGMESVLWPQTTVLLIPDAHKNHLNNKDSWLYFRGPASVGLGKGPGIGMNKLSPLEPCSETHCLKALMWLIQGYAGKLENIGSQAPPPVLLIQ